MRCSCSLGSRSSSSSPPRSPAGDARPRGRRGGRAAARPRHVDGDAAGGRGQPDRDRVAHAVGLAGEGRAGAPGPRDPARAAPEVLGRRRARRRRRDRRRLRRCRIQPGCPEPTSTRPRPTSASQPAPVPSGSTGYEQGTMVLAADSRTPAPRQSAIAATVRGRASWYGVDGDVAAAGPALRHGHWRGSLVAVCADRCVTVRLVDFCQCLRGQRSERVIDLSPSAFARLAPLSAGLIRVTVSAVHVLPPPTDR
jgi:hypothetical protein